MKAKNMAILDHERCYSALCTRDARFDGIFFTAVKSTGIYCRPICSAKTPKSENCTFYQSAAQAELAGYRPCLKCRPEMAPGYADVEQHELLFLQATEMMQQLPKSVETVAEQLGISARHLRRIFSDALGITPHQYLQTARLLAAKQLLTDTMLTQQEISETVGFGSISTFNRLFKTHYHMAPSTLAKHIKESHHQTKSTDVSSTCKPTKAVIGYRPTMNWQQLLAFFEMRAIPGVEWVNAAEGIYRRTVSRPVEGWLEVVQVQNMGESQSLTQSPTQSQTQTHIHASTIVQKPSRYALQLTVSETLAPYLQVITRQVRHAFDLSVNSEQLPEGIPADTRLPGCFDPFEMAVRAILGQQITVKAARTLATRMTQTLGQPLEKTISPWPELTHTFPRPENFEEPSAAENLVKLGILSSRAQTIVRMAHAILANQLQLIRGFDTVKMRKQLLTIKGIGPWTADYILMRTTGWPNVFLPGDVGVLHGLSMVLGIPRTALKAPLRKIEAMYAPWLSYLVISLWQGTWQPTKATIARIIDGETISEKET